MPDQPLTASAKPEIAPLALADLAACLRLGWRDFRAAPLYGLGFSCVYVALGLGLTLLGASTFVWTLALALGFPLVAPFAAVGLYEVSRRLEAGAPLEPRAILGVVVAERHRQLPWMGAILVLIFLFWSFFAHMTFALFMGLSALTNITSSWQALLTPNGMTMIAVELVVGGAVALLTYALTVIAMPYLLDREVDFVTAMLTSLRVVAAHRGVMLVWAALIAGVLGISMLPLFLGLFVSLPVLGHASWHLYRRALVFGPG